MGADDTFRTRAAAPDAADIVKRRRDEIAELSARETGSTVPYSAFQQDLVANTLQQATGWVYLNKGEVLQSNQPHHTHSIGVRRPLGVVVSFTPWNGANILSWRAVISPVAAGNTVVVKPSEFAPVNAGILLAEIAEEAGFRLGSSTSSPTHRARLPPSPTSCLAVRTSVSST